MKFVIEFLIVIATFFKKSAQLNFVFINLFGFIAAAYTTLFCYISFSAFHYFAMRIVLKNSGNTARIYDMRAIILISIILLGGIIGINILYSNTVARRCVIDVIVVLIVMLKKKIMIFVREIIAKY